MTRHIAGLVSAAIVLGAAIGAGAEAPAARGPLGVKYGSTEQVNPHPIERTVDLDKGEDDCIRALTNINHAGAPEAWGLDSRPLLRDVRATVEFEQSLRSNSLAIDLSLGRRVRATWRRVNGDFLACFAYFDDKLFLIHSPGLEWAALREQFYATMSNRHGSGNTLCGRVVCIQTWLDLENDALITAVSPPIVGYFQYLYAPLRRQHMKEMISKYKEAFNERFK